MAKTNTKIKPRINAYYNESDIFKSVDKGTFSYLYYTLNKAVFHAHSMLYRTCKMMKVSFKFSYLYDI